MLSKYNFKLLLYYVSFEILWENILNVFYYFYKSLCWNNKCFWNFFIRKARKGKLINKAYLKAYEIILVSILLQGVRDLYIQELVQIIICSHITVCKIIVIQIIIKLQNVDYTYNIEYKCAKISKTIKTKLD